MQSVDLKANEVHIGVQVPGDLPATGPLLTTLSDALPSGVTVVVNSAVGTSVTAGQTS